MARYILASRFYDGSVVLPRGAELEIPEGVTPPPGAKLVEEPKAETPPPAKA